MADPDGPKLTGRKVAFIIVAAFGVVVAVNVTMAVLAVGGFPGLVVKNPFAAAQHFDAELKAERALGWRFATAWEAGELAVRVDDAEGAPAPGLEVSARVGRPANQTEDHFVTFAPRGEVYAADLDLGPGLWRVDITARRGDGAVYTISDEIYVPKGEATAPGRSG